jgi:hypothetical protein
MARHITEVGVPLRGDGTPFPHDPSAWTAEERDYLETYFFHGELRTGIDYEQVAVVDVPDMNEPADDVTNVASTAWYVIESSKPSPSLATNSCNAVPAGVSDPLSSLGPNRLTWRLQLENAFTVDVVDIEFDLRWEYGARHSGGGAFIPNCYLYVPTCSVLWGFDVNVQIHAHSPTNGGTGAAPMARLPLTVDGTVSSLVNDHGVRWDFVLCGDGSYQVS